MPPSLNVAWRGGAGVPLPLDQQSAKWIFQAVSRRYDKGLNGPI